jgi:hypothetical protein
MLTYTVNENNVLSILKDGNVVDVYTPWDTKEGAEAWAEMICAKYNDNPDLPYPPIEIEATDGAN